MTKYEDKDGDRLCDWCGEPNHEPNKCIDILDKSIATFKRAVLYRTARKRELPE